MHTVVYRTSFSAGPPAKVEPLKIDLVADGKPVRVRLCIYSQEQREFLATFVYLLVAAGMAYFNPPLRGLALHYCFPGWARRSTSSPLINVLSIGSPSNTSSQCPIMSRN